MFQFIIWIVTAPFRFVIWLFKTWKWYIACGILAVITIAGVVIFIVATAKKPAAITTTTTQSPTIPNDIQGAIHGADPFPLLLRGEGYHLWQRLCPDALLVFQYFFRPVGKIRFSHHHAELWKD